MSYSDRAETRVSTVLKIISYYLRGLVTQLLTFVLVTNIVTTLVVLLCGLVAAVEPPIPTVNPYAYPLSRRLWPCFGARRRAVAVRIVNLCRWEKPGGNSIPSVFQHYISKAIASRTRRLNYTDTTECTPRSINIRGSDTVRQR